MSMDFNINTLIKLDPRIFSGLPPGATLHVRRNLSAYGVTACIPAIGAEIELEAWDERQAMAELVDKVHALIARRAKAHMRAGRHDRGWPKIAA